MSSVWDNFWSDPVVISRWENKCPKLWKTKIQKKEPKSLNCPNNHIKCWSCLLANKRWLKTLPPNVSCEYCRRMFAATWLRMLSANCVLAANVGREYSLTVLAANVSNIRCECWLRMLAGIGGDYSLRMLAAKIGCKCRLRSMMFCELLNRSYFNNVLLIIHWKEMDSRVDFHSFVHKVRSNQFRASIAEHFKG